MNNPDHIFESLETIFGVKLLKFFDADPGSGIFFNPGSGMEKIQIRDKHPVSGTLLMIILFGWVPGTQYGVLSTYRYS
jgi:hypothetical protein